MKFTTRPRARYKSWPMAMRSFNAHDKQNIKAQDVWAMISVRQDFLCGIIKRWKPDKSERIVK